MSDVNEKVARLTLENKEFEKNAQQSIKTLSKLNESMQSMNSSSGLDKIASSAKSVDLKGLSNDVNQVSKSFTLLGKVGSGIMTNLSGDIYRFGKNIAAQLSGLQAARAGFAEYELKIGSIQTIMASTGASVKEVNKYLNELNTYSDRTIYSFSDMTENIGKFTNSGVKLKVAVKAIQGISNEAAVSGANANEASRAMYNFAQALSTGSVKLIDWKSIENANMATVEFKNELIKTAVALGTLKKAGNGTYKVLTHGAGNKAFKDTMNATKNFNDSLSSQWLTTNVLVKTLARYSDETTKIGKKAFAAAEDVKTFSQMMDTLKESVGSQWTQTWEYLFGDIDEAKTLWTALNNVLDGIITRSGKTRNAILKIWHDDGGREAFIKGFGNLNKAIDSVIDPARKAFRSVFPVDYKSKSKWLVSVSKAFNSLTKKLIITSKTSSKIHDVSLKLFTSIKSWTSEAKNGIDAVLKFVEPVKNIFEALEKRIAKTVLPKIESELKAIRKAINPILKSSSIDEFVGRTENELKHLWSIFRSKNSKLYSSIKPFVSYIYNATSRVRKSILNLLHKIDFDKVIEKFNSLWHVTKKTAPDAVLNKLKDAFSALEHSAVKLYKVLDPLSSIKYAIKALASALESVIQSIGNVDTAEGKAAKAVKNAKTLVGGVPGVVGKVDAAIGKIAISIKNIARFLNSFFKGNAKNWTIDRVFEIAKMEALLKLIRNISGVFEGLPRLSQVITKTFSSFNKLVSSKALNVKSEAIKNVAISLAILAGSLALLSLIDQKNLEKAGIVLASIAAGLGTFVFILSKIDVKSVGKSVALLSIALFAIAGSVASVAVSLSILVGTLSLFQVVIKQYAKMDMKSFMSAFAKIQLIIGEFAKFLASTAFVGKNGKSVAITLLALVAALFILRKTLEYYNKLDPKVFDVGLSRISYVIQQLKKFLFATSFIPGFKSAGVGIEILALGVTVKAFSKIISELGSIDSSKVNRGLNAIKVIMTSITALIAVMNITSKYISGSRMLGEAASLMALSATIGTIATAIGTIGSLDTKTLGQGVGAISAMLLELGIFIKSISSIDAGKKMSSAADSLKALSGALAAIVASIVILGGLSKEQLLKGIGALGAALTALFAIFKMETSKTALKAEAARTAMLLASVVTISFMLIKIAKMPWKNVAAAGLAMSAAMDSMAIGMTSLKTLGKKVSPESIAGVALTLASLGVVTFMIAKLAAYPWKNVAAAGLAMSVAMLAISGAITILSFIPVSAGIKAALSISSFVAIILAVISAIGALYKNPVVADVINNGAAALAKIGDAIGGFIGGIKAGIMKANAAGLSAAANDLEYFSNHAAPFFKMVNNFDSSATESIKSISKLIESLGKTGNAANSDTVHKFADNLGIIGPALKTFSSDTSGINIVSVESSAKAVDILSGIKIPTDTQIFGNKFEDFSENIVYLGKGVKNFGSAVSGINGSDITTAAKAVKTISSIKLDDSQFNFLYKHAKENFTNLGDAIGGFGNAVKGINSYDLNEAAKATSVLAKIDLKSGIKITGNVYKRAKENFTNLGDAIGEFAKSTNGISFDNITKAAEAITTLGKIKSINGDSISGAVKLSAKLPLLGTALSGFYNNISSIDAGVVASSVSSISKFSKIDFSGFAAKDNDKAIKAFDSGIKSIGSAVKDFNNSIGLIDPEGFKANVNTVKTLSGINNLPSLDGVGTFSKNAKKLGDALNTFVSQFTDVSAKKLASSISTLNTLSRIKNVPDIGGINDFEANSKQLGAALKNVADASNGINVKSVSASVSLLGKISTIKEIPKLENASDFKSNSEIIATTLKTFSTGKGGIFSGVNPQSVQSAIDLVNRFSDLKKLSSLDNTANIGNNVKTLGTGIKSFVDSVKNISGDDISKKVDAITGVKRLSKIGNLKNLARSASSIKSFGNAIKKFVSGAQGLSNAIVNATKLKDLSADLKKSDFGGFAKALGTAASGGIKAFDAKFNKNTSMKSAVVKASNSAAKAAKSDSIISNYKTAGTNAAAGFVHGITNAINNGSVSEAGAALGNAAYKAAKKALVEHSPSKKMHKVGENAAKGFSNGLADKKAIKEIKKNGRDLLSQKFMKKLSANSSKSMKDAGKNCLTGFLIGLQDADIYANVYSIGSNIGTTLVSATNNKIKKESNKNKKKSKKASRKKNVAANNLSKLESYALLNGFVKGFSETSLERALSSNAKTIADTFLKSIQDSSSKAFKSLTEDNRVIGKLFKQLKSITNTVELKKLQNGISGYAKALYQSSDYYEEDISAIKDALSSRNDAINRAKKVDASWYKYISKRSLTPKQLQTSISKEISKTNKSIKALQKRLKKLKNSSSSTRTKVENNLEKAKNKLAELKGASKDLANAFGSLRRASRKEFENIQKAVQDDIDSIKSTLSSFNDVLSNSLSSIDIFSSIGEKSGTTYLNDRSEALENYNKALEEYNVAKAEYDRTAETDPNAYDKGIGRSKEFLDNLKEKEKALKDATDAMQKYYDADIKLGDALSDSHLTDASTSKAKELAKNIEDQKNYFSDYITSYEQLINRIKSLFTGEDANVANNLFTKIAESGADGLENIKGFLAMSNDELTNYLNNFKKITALQGEDFANKVKLKTDDLKSFISTIDELRNFGISPSLLADLVSKGPDANDYAQALLQLAKDTAYSKSSTWRDVFMANGEIDRANSAVDSQAKKLEGSKINSYSGITKFGTVDDLKKREDELAKAISLFGTKSKAEADYNAALNAYNKALTASQKASKEVAKYENLSKKSKKNKKKYAKKLASAKSTAASASKTLSNTKSAMNAKKSVYDSWESTFESYKSQLVSIMYELGKYVDQGFAEGLENYAYYSNNGAQFVANGAMNTVANTLGIHSPSKVFEKFGHYLNLGFAKGLIESKNETENAAVIVASSLTNAIQDSINDSNPMSIRPVLDFSNAGITPAGIMANGISADLKRASQIQNGFSTTNNDNSQSIVNNFNITGSDPKSIADEVSKVLQKQVNRRNAVWA